MKDYDNIIHSFTGIDALSNSTNETSQIVETNALEQLLKTLVVKLKTSEEKQTTLMEFFVKMKEVLFDSFQLMNKDFRILTQHKNETET